MIPALENFSAHIPRGGKVLCADANAQAWFVLRGIEVELIASDKDLRFLSPKRESWDGIWVGHRMSAYSIEDAQRIVAAFFQALRPQKGVFFAIHSFAPEAFASMFRQNGFQIRLSAQNGEQQAVLGQRI